VTIRIRESSTTLPRSADEPQRTSENEPKIWNASGSLRQSGSGNFEEAVSFACIEEQPAPPNHVTIPRLGVVGYDVLAGAIVQRVENPMDQPPIPESGQLVPIQKGQKALRNAGGKKKALFDQGRPLLFLGKDQNQGKAGSALGSWVDLQRMPENQKQEGY
jgi:hypothetical protein